MLKQIFILFVCAFVAVVMGVVLASPLQSTHIALLLALAGILLFPILLKWNYAITVFAWNASMIVAFLPGQPSLAILAALCTLVFAVLNRSLKKRNQFLKASGISWALIFLAAVVLVTSVMTGGIGGQFLGGEAAGAKRYFGVLGAILGYFALTSQEIPQKRRNLYAAMFFLSGMTAIVSDIAVAAGPAFYFLFAFFPPQLAFSQVISQDTLLRLSGVAFAALSGCYFMLMRYGLRGIVSWHKPWRVVVFALLAAASLLGGYRSAVVILAILVVVHFCAEGLFRTRMLPAFVLSATLLFAILAVTLHKLPLSIQRSLSFLPVKVAPAARADAESTTQWRLDMWRALLPEVPQHLLLGKGYKYSAADYYLIQQAKLRGIQYSSFEEILVSGDYHNGILTILLPFGVFGLIGFLWFCCAALKLLYSNYKFGDPSLSKINTFLLSLFAARLIYYLFFYGQFFMDLAIFVGIVAFSIALNGNTRRNRISCGKLTSQHDEALYSEANPAL